MQEIIVTPHWIEIPEIELAPITLPETESRFNSKIDTYLTPHGSRFIEIKPYRGKAYCFEVFEANPLEYGENYGVLYVMRC
ncbi:MAG: hypothetical protein AAF512_06740 [Pseudomonadota bacterium]